jgi:hypothetical protein
MYKARGEFYVDKRLFHNIAQYCKICARTYSAGRKVFDREKVRKRANAAYKANPEKQKERSKCYIEKYPDRRKKGARDFQRRARVYLSDTYVSYVAKKSGNIVSPETIELKRQQIIAKRTLKQLKEWRAKHESDRDVISGKQRKDEAVNEINRGREETGHGGDSGLPAGVRDSG